MISNIFIKLFSEIPAKTLVVIGLFYILFSTDKFPVRRVSCLSSEIPYRLWYKRRKFQKDYDDAFSYQTHLPAYWTKFKLASDADNC